jgi:hypothetical protein
MASVAMPAGGSSAGIDWTHWWPMSGIARRLVAYFEREYPMKPEDIVALDDAEAEVLAAEKLLSYKPDPRSGQVSPQPPQGAELARALICAMKERGYEQKLLPDPQAHGGEIYFVRAALEVPPEEEYLRYENNPASIATATCKAALIALCRNTEIDSSLTSAAG